MGGKNILMNSAVSVWQIDKSQKSQLVAWLDGERLAVYGYRHQDAGGGKPGGDDDAKANQ
jgi:hypothetical protein